MINLCKLRYMNILSTGNQWTEIDLSSDKTTVIIGDNGAGKSTMIDALAFALFNKPFRKINKPQLLNTITQKGLLVEVEFNVNSASYMIRRGIKPSVFEIFKDGELLNQTADSRDYQEVLEKQILRMNYKSFCQVVAIGSAKYTSFMQLATGARREVIEDLLDLQVFTTMNEILQKRLKANAADIKEVETEITLRTSQIEGQKRLIAKAQESNDALVLEKQNRITEAQEHIERLQMEIENLASEVQDIEDGLKDETEVSTKISQILDMMRKAESKSNLLRDEITFLKSNDECPSCRQSIAEGFKEPSIAEKEKVRSDLAEAVTKLVGKRDELSVRHKEITLQRSYANAKSTDIRVKRSQIDGFDRQIVQYEADIKKLETKTEEKTPDTFELDSLNAVLEACETKYNGLHDDRRVMQAAGVLLKDGGIKAKIVKQYAPIINKLINKYLAAMDFYVDFQFDENFNETIKSRHRDDFSYASFSEGEKQKIDLAILFTWRAIAKMRNSLDTNLLIMDEVMDSSLDAKGQDDFMLIMKVLAEEANVFVISHRTDAIEALFDRVIKFKKLQNFSQMVIA